MEGVAGEMKRIAIVAVTALVLWAKPMTEAEKIRQQNMEVVKAAAASMNETLPKRIDPYTRLLRIEADGERLVYDFEVDAGPRSDEELRKRQPARTRIVREGVCSRSARFLQSGIVIVYRYISAATKKPLFDVVVRKEDCRFMD